MVGGPMLQGYLESRAEYGTRATNEEFGRQIRHGARLVASYLVLRWVFSSTLALLPKATTLPDRFHVPYLTVLLAIILVGPFLLATRGAELLRRLAAWLAR